MRPAPFIFLFALAATLSASALDTPPSNSTEIVVDQNCRISAIAGQSAGTPRPRHRYDGGICRLDGGVKRTLSWETKIQNGTSKEQPVQVVEREFLLHNPYPDAVTFVVKQQVAKKYRIDSDPQPNEMNGPVATFRVIAAPNQTVRLHVGERKP